VVVAVVSDVCLEPCLSSVSRGVWRFDASFGGRSARDDRFEDLSLIDGVFFAERLRGRSS
jgi:hypothetical protein